MVPDVPDGQRQKTILVVDDEAPILGLVRSMLVRAGYQVLEAADPDQALRIASDDAVWIDLLLTDLLMPGMNGFQLAEKVRKMRPGVRVLFMTGYPDRVLAQSAGQVAPSTRCLRKPFKQHALTEMIADLIARP